MSRIIAGGKRSSGWVADAITEYEERLKKPFDIIWEVLDEEKLASRLERWDFSPDQVVIIADEKGKNITSPDLADKLEKIFISSCEPVIIIGGSGGISADAHENADFVWSFSNLVFPHMLARVVTTEQIYRAQEIARGSKYHRG